MPPNRSSDTTTCLHVTPYPTEQIRQLLHANIIGTAGISMCYQHTQVNVKLDAIAQPYFVALQRNTNMVGTCCFCQRYMSLAGHVVVAYIRYFSMQQAFRRGPTTPRMVQRTTTLRREITSLLQGRHWATPHPSFFHYAYVDPRNVRSANLCREFGFETVRHYTTILFSRLSLPRRGATNIEWLSAAEIPCMRERLRETYQDYTMFTEDNLFQNQPYAVVRNAAGIFVAGVQATPERWQIHRLPGTHGRAALAILSNTPWLNRLISRTYQFLALEGIYCQPGNEPILQHLIEGLLAQHRVHTAMTVVDADAPLHTVLRTLDLGPADKLMKPVRGEVIVKAINLSPEQRQRLKDYPAYISVTDVT